MLSVWVCVFVQCFELHPYFDVLLSVNHGSTDALLLMQTSVIERKALSLTHVFLSNTGIRKCCIHLFTHRGFWFWMIWFSCGIFCIYVPIWLSASIGIIHFSFMKAKNSTVCSQDILVIYGVDEGVKDVATPFSVDPLSQRKHRTEGKCLPHSVPSNTSGLFIAPDIVFHMRQKKMKWL